MDNGIVQQWLHQAEIGLAPQAHPFDRSIWARKFQILSSMMTLLSSCQAETGQGVLPFENLIRHLTHVGYARTEQAKFQGLSGLGGQVVPYEQAVSFLPTLQELCRRSGLRSLPIMYSSDEQIPNAYAVGDASVSHVMITKCLSNCLNPDESEGITAHEIGHISNGDTWLFAVASELHRMTLEAVDAINPAVSPMAASLKSLAGGISQLLQRELSRICEEGADRSAILMTGKPFSLISALEKMETMFSSMKASAGTITPQPPNLVSEVIQLLDRTHPLTPDRCSSIMAFARS